MENQEMKNEARIGGSGLNAGLGGSFSTEELERDLFEARQALLAEGVRHAAVLERLLRTMTERRDGYLRDTKRFAAAGNYATAANLAAHYEAHGMVCMDIQRILTPNELG